MSYNLDSLKGAVEGIIGFRVYCFIGDYHRGC